MAKFGKATVRLGLPRDPLFRLLAINGLAGIAIAALVLGGIFWANVGNLRVLVLNSDNPVLPVVMLAFGLVITLGSVVIGSAIMLLGENGGGGGTRLRANRLAVNKSLQPLPVTAAGHHRKNMSR